MIYSLSQPAPDESSYLRGAMLSRNRAIVIASDAIPIQGICRLRWDSLSSDIGVHLLAGPAPADARSRGARACKRAGPAYTETRVCMLGVPNRPLAFHSEGQPGTAPVTAGEVHPATTPARPTDVAPIGSTGAFVLRPVRAMVEIAAHLVAVRVDLPAGLQGAVSDEVAADPDLLQSALP